jgi:hypothetical protein
LSADTCRQAGHILLVLRGGTAMTDPPRQACLYSRRLRQVAYLQVLDAHDRVVLTDRGRGFVQVVAPGMDGYAVRAGLSRPEGGGLSRIRVNKAHRPLSAS